MEETIYPLSLKTMLVKYKYAGVNIKDNNISPLKTMLVKYK